MIGGVFVDISFMGVRGLYMCGGMLLDEGYTTVRGEGSLLGPYFAVTRGHSRKRDSPPCRCDVKLSCRVNFAIIKSAVGRVLR